MKIHYHFHYKFMFKGSNKYFYSVQFGEILIVHDQPEDEWIWAESVLTGNSGSVAIDIVEDLDQFEDPFLGYIWFNSDRAKSECEF